MTEYDRFGDRDAVSGSDPVVGPGTSAILATVQTRPTSPETVASRSNRRAAHRTMTSRGLAKHHPSDIAA